MQVISWFLLIEYTAHQNQEAIVFLTPILKWLEQKTIYFSQKTEDRKEILKQNINKESGLTVDQPLRVRSAARAQFLDTWI